MREPFPKPGWCEPAVRWEWLWKKRQKARFSLLNLRLLSQNFSFGKASRDAVLKLGFETAALDLNVKTSL
jgi:hypothetical protein